MRPKIVMHAQISLDGCVRGFIDTGVYYAVANRFNADMVLFGSETVYTAAEHYPPETEKAFKKPTDRPDDQRLRWVVPDSRGRLRNLHVFRDSEYCKDIIVLVSASTPPSYLEYLRERNYDFIAAGDDHVDYAQALEVLYKRYNCRITRTDSGGVLTNALIEQGLVDEISLVVSPCLVGTGEPHLFRSLSLPNRMPLELISCETVDEKHIFLIYKVLK
ncbi:RibD family protein [Syntrophomonas wolfei]|uniref:RibD family protein n=1 Tax=Syntrophomonas wolfei TaxID=863 RepID=UPI000774D8A1|nr:RibD family protein [Syntrophomonas wolfei]